MTQHMRKHRSLIGPCFGCSDHAPDDPTAAVAETQAEDTALAVTIADDMRAAVTKLAIATGTDPEHVAKVVVAEGGHRIPVSTIFRVHGPRGSTDLFWEDLSVFGYEETEAGARRFAEDAITGVPLQLSDEIREQGDNAPHADLLARGEKLRAQIRVQRRAA